MTYDQMKALKVGDRVRRTPGGTGGTVTDKRHGVSTVTWDDGSAPARINPRCPNDRRRARDVEPVANPTPPGGERKLT